MMLFKNIELGKKNKFVPRKVTKLVWAHVFPKLLFWNFGFRQKDDA